LREGKMKVEKQSKVVQKMVTQIVEETHYIVTKGDETLVLELPLASITTGTRTEVLVVGTPVTDVNAPMKASAEQLAVFMFKHVSCTFMDAFMAKYRELGRS
jgi:hypothetical protein